MRDRLIFDIAVLDMVLLAAAGSIVVIAIMVARMRR